MELDHAFIRQCFPGLAGGTVLADNAGGQERVSTIAFTIDGRRSDDVVDAFDRCDIGIRHGHFYAHRAIDALGLADRGGVIRVSLVHYNTLDEVDRIIAALDETTAPLE